MPGSYSRPQCYPTTTPADRIAFPFLLSAAACAPAALLQAASAFLFAFDPTDLRLADIIQDDRCGLRMPACLRQAHPTHPQGQDSSRGRHTHDPCPNACARLPAWCWPPHTLAGGFAWQQCPPPALVWSRSWALWQQQWAGWASSHKRRPSSHKPCLRVAAMRSHHQQTQAPWRQQ